MCLLVMRLFYYKTCEKEGTPQFYLLLFFYNETFFCLPFTRRYLLVFLELSTRDKISHDVLSDISSFGVKMVCLIIKGTPC